ncbi:class I SAM-dependent methyltransferase [Sinomonas halotolerans]|uniref:Class I SAM-dependent methyltransferase n=1 Tax=Sinomonas halotolerans TaxID=1644133 RepID=A0ABU9X0Q2_9MICC
MDHTEHPPAAPHPGEFWDGFYSERENVWSGKPNAALVREMELVAPGTALELGCGEGADSIWLAQRGWTVTAVDVSSVALGRAAQHAAQAGVGNSITFARHDLAEWEPAGEYDLVAALFLHSPVDFPRERVLARAARTVAPGGTLLVVGHASFPPWSQHAHDDAAPLPSAEEVAQGLGLPSHEWSVETREAEGRTARGPEGQTVVLTDTVLRARRAR